MADPASRICSSLGRIMTCLVSDEGEEMGNYAEYALSDWFEVAQDAQTNGYWSAVVVAGSWLHKISMDGRWK